MSALFQVDEFADFFSELWSRHPFPWQMELARRLCLGECPKYIAAPTGSGKTACLDAAVFSLAYQSALPMEQRSMGRRIFFIVNRRVIVDEAYARAGTMAELLFNAAPTSTTGRVAQALRTLSGELGGAPLSRAQLRDGVYRDRLWAKSLLQPMIICSTVDQAGSRLLFRGYGVREESRSIHAALVAQDSLLIVDEAHISKPFVQTLNSVARYRTHLPESTGGPRLPFKIIQMTATPPPTARASETLALSGLDLQNPTLNNRLQSAKPARMVIEEKAKGKTRDKILAERLAHEAKIILEEANPRSLLLMVNWVATARFAEQALQGVSNARITLLIGRLRPFDRETATNQVQQILKTGVIGDSWDGVREIVVSTQCLEVGADLDFDALVTEAASLDSLRQRFGRLNRGGRAMIPRAVIALPADQNLTLEKLVDSSPCDPIYGNAIPRTWAWLQSISTNGEVNFGIRALGGEIDSLRNSENGEQKLEAMLSPTGSAPVMLPDYLDCWAQTCPSPALEPDISLFLHGPQRDMAEVQVCWRADLPTEFQRDLWAETLSLCPPTAAECLPVPMKVFCAWLKERSSFQDHSGDADESSEAVERENNTTGFDLPAMIWQTPETSRQLKHARDLKVGDTVILRAQDGGWSDLGVLPGNPLDPMRSKNAVLSIDQLRAVDIAERSIAKTHRLAVVRVREEIWPHREDSASRDLLWCAQNPESNLTRTEIKTLLQQIAAEPNSGFDETSLEMMLHLSQQPQKLLRVDSYPDGRGLVISSKVPLASCLGYQFEDLLETDSEELLEGEPINLEAHTNHVLQRLERSLAKLPLGAWNESLTTAARLHDWGKADPRFQALLRAGSKLSAFASNRLLAKSGGLTPSFIARRQARERSELPRRFRHEMLSMQMAQEALNPSPLVLHLIASHHGYARPFAPVVSDANPPDVPLPSSTEVLSSEIRSAKPPHALDSGVADRFWQLTRSTGWWGLAYLETVLRLADQAASAHPDSNL